MKTAISLFIALLGGICFVMAQNKPKEVPKITRYNYKQYIEEAPRFTIYGDNYFVSGTQMNHSISEETSDARFEIGFKERLVDKPLPWDIYLFLAYRQKAFWDIYKESFPFRALNYNPSLGLGKVIFDEEDKLKGAFWFQVEHESNGEADSISRSWNRFSLSYFLPVSEHFLYTVKAWLPVGSMSDNSDITEYLGYGQVDMAYRPNSRWIFEASARKGVEGWKGSLQLGVNFRITKTGNEFVYLQFFQGYGQDLINYNKELTYLRLGFSIKDMSFNFY
ncbi:phospholipase [Neptunitalea chrysea]|uniref:Phosphatidylcholine 1-acylhydrolase n=1 Tax=Neptunitalea chrysea TaxID=1647581 RepID=A0A9W6B8N6_9FLAO|nr:phospholipase A [Neptunitalea chrysea]GLB52978.1 phospholipase [Neptunitalea chrysea]